MITLNARNGNRYLRKLITAYKIRRLILSIQILVTGFIYRLTIFQLHRGSPRKHRVPIAIGTQRTWLCGPLWLLSGPLCKFFSLYWGIIWISDLCTFFSLYGGIIWIRDLYHNKYIEWKYYYFCNCLIGRKINGSEDWNADLFGEFLFLKRQQGCGGLYKGLPQKEPSGGQDNLQGSQVHEPLQ